MKHGMAVDKKVVKKQILYKIKGANKGSLIFNKGRISAELFFVIRLELIKNNLLVKIRMCIYSYL